MASVKANAIISKIGRGGKERVPISIAENRDCMVAMKEFPDKFFDLAVVDPPYGSGMADNGGCKGWFSKYRSQSVNVERESRISGTASEKDLTDTNTAPKSYVNRVSGTGNRNTTSVHLQRKNCRKPDGTWGYANWRDVGNEVHKKIISWDVAPGQDYFEELFRISRNQIIWGGNYFSLPPTRCFLIWRKLSISETFSMAMAEYAWTSFRANAKVFEFAPQGKANDPRFHPTQKPIELYDWIFLNFAKPGMKVIDTHLGSGSSRIAAYNANLDFWGYEIDKYYFDKQEERFAKCKSQQSLFIDTPKVWEQTTL